VIVEGLGHLEDLGCDGENHDETRSAADGDTAVSCERSGNQF